MIPSTPKSPVPLANQAPVATIFCHKSRLTTYCLTLMVAAGRHLNIYEICEVKPGKPSPKPARSLDLEAAL